MISPSSNSEIFKISIIDDIDDISLATVLTLLICKNIKKIILLLSNESHKKIKLFNSTCMFNNFIVSIVSNNTIDDPLFSVFSNEKSAIEYLKN